MPRGNKVMRALSVFTCVCVCTCVCIECLALWGRTGSVCCAWLTESRAPGAASCVYTWTKAARGRKMFHHTRSDHLQHTQTHLLPLSVHQNRWSAAPFFPSICVHLSRYVQPFIIPPLTPRLSLTSAQSHHTGSLFLANLSLIHYWDLFFFLES